MFDYATQEINDYRDESVPERDIEVIKKEKGFVWVLLLIPLFVFVGWAARDYVVRISAATSSVQYGTGQVLNVPCISPNSNPYTSPIESPSI